MKLVIDKMDLAEDHFEALAIARAGGQADLAEDLSQRIVGFRKMANDG